MPYERNLGRVVGTMIYSGTAINSAAIITDLTGRGITRILDGDLYFSVTQAIAIWQYDAESEQFTKLADIWDQSIIQGLINATASKHQTTIALIQSPVKNINGREFVHYTAVETTIGGYEVYQIKKDGNNCTEDDAAEYLEYMNGSLFVSKYNYDKPRYSYFILPDGTMLKPQWDSTNGLVLYKLSAIALKDYVDEELEKKADKALVVDNLNNKNYYPKLVLDTDDELYLVMTPVQ